MNLLLLSNSTNYGDPYLHHAKSVINNYLQGVKKVLFIPYAGVTVSYNDYEKKVKDALLESNIEITSIHHFNNPIQAIQQAESIAIGGGNTFQLLAMLQKSNLMQPIQNKVLKSTPYIGWSAGSNLAGPTICTTNDMPIVQPESFNALNLVPFQINPHYTESTIPNHGGETRRDRLNEYLQLNQKSEVICLPEGTWLQLKNNICTIGGEHPVLKMVYSKNPEVATGSTLQNHFK